MQRRETWPGYEGRGVQGCRGHAMGGESTTMVEELAGFAEVAIRGLRAAGTPPEEMGVLV